MTIAESDVRRPDRAPEPVEVRPDAVAPLRRPGRRPFKVLLFGGGALVGWGLLDHERGLPGRLADRLVQDAARGVDLDVVVAEDPTEPEALDRLLGFGLPRYDAVAVVLGERHGLQHLGRTDWSRRVEALVAALESAAAPIAPLLVLDSSRSMVAVSATGLKRLRAGAGAGRLAQVARGVCDGGRVAFDELAVPANPLGWGRQFATADHRAWAATIADRLLPAMLAADPDEGPDAPRVLRERPQDEEARQRAVDALPLGGARDGLLDGIARQARTAYRAAAAYVTLVDGDRVRQIASTRPVLGEAPRELAFCSRTILGDAPTVVADARLDPRFGGEPPLVMGDPVAFYAGEPVHAPDGHRIGALCVMDASPRVVASAHLGELHVLAGRVERELWTRSLLLR